MSEQEHINKKRKINDTKQAVQDEVTSHYQALPARTREGFSSSPIAPLKALNSWTKAWLITLYVKNNDNVLELCCGRGGEAAKYHNESLLVNRVVWCDVAGNSVAQAHERLTTDAKRGLRGYKSDFVVADCFQVNLHQENLITGLFDIVSCQMAFHYCFENERKARVMLYNVAKALKPGGFFLGTLPGYNQVRRKMGMGFRNSVVQLQYDHFPNFGARYKFKLLEGAQHAINAPEYLVYKDTLVRLAQIFHLKLEVYMPFHQFHATHSRSPEGQMLYQRMLRKHPQIPPDQWEAYGLYSVMVFRRLEGEMPKNVDFSPVTLSTDDDGIRHAEIRT